MKHIKLFEFFVNEQKDTKLKILADLIYDDSLESLNNYWNNARDNSDPDVLIDQMESEYDPIGNNKVSKEVEKYILEHDITYEELWGTEHQDENKMTLRDLLYEAVDAGIN